jgi:hypothetical protein
MTIVIGCDPGISGAIAFLDHNGCRVVFDIPVRLKTEVAKTKNEVDPIALRKLLRENVPLDQGAICVMESQHAFMGSGAQRMGSMASQASLAATKAVIATVIELSGLDTVFVTPQVWQREFGIKRTDKSDTKEQSLKIARELFGVAGLTRKKDNGRSDALLIARYGMNHLV